MNKNRLMTFCVLSVRALECLSAGTIAKSCFPIIDATFCRDNTNSTEVMVEHGKYFTVRGCIFEIKLGRNTSKRQQKKKRGRELLNRIIYVITIRAQQCCNLQVQVSLPPPFLLIVCFCVYLILNVEQRNGIFYFILVYKKQKKHTLNGIKRKKKNNINNNTFFNSIEG